MNIQPISFQHKQNYQCNSNAPSFEATFPVVHWVSETNASASPEFALDVVKILQGKLIRLINKVNKNKAQQQIKFPLPNDILIPPELKIYNYLKSCDLDFRRQPKIRSFYDRTTNENSSRPVAYAITGADIEVFENTLAKNIGIEKKEARKTLGTPYSQKAKAAIDKYSNSGLKFVLSPEKRIYDNNRNPYVLHTHFVIRRNKNGEIKGYDLVNAKFLPQKNS